jgi:protoporphyrinogen oxidase
LEKPKNKYVIVGSGFSGLATGLALAEAGLEVIILERDHHVGGLASDFKLDDGSTIERFYHHWFTSDSDITKVINDLGCSAQIQKFATRTGMYFNKNLWELSSPVDLLKFSALSFLSRLRLGLSLFWIRYFSTWEKIEHLSIREWLQPICGKEAYSVVWEPLIRAKFSEFAEDISASWMFKKIVLRGSSRNSNGSEVLMYFQGGFGQLAELMAKRIKELGGVVILGADVKEIEINELRVSNLSTKSGDNYQPKELIFTGSPKELADVLSSNTPKDWENSLNQINYLSNICLVLILNTSLSNTYWLNVNDPSFPFVGVIEHTNMVSSKAYNGAHVVYLSRYISHDHPDYQLTDVDYYNLSITHLKKMFPNFNLSDVRNYFVWRARYAQPITTKNYSKLVQKINSPIMNLHLVSMAQVYPEDRGTNYAVRYGLNLAKKLIDESIRLEK